MGADVFCSAAFVFCIIYKKSSIKCHLKKLDTIVLFHFYNPNKANISSNDFMI